MQPNSEPTPADVAAVSAAMGNPAPQQPAPQQQPQPQQPAPAQMQPSQPTSQPAPTQQPAQATEPTDGFASLFTQPTEPTAPTTPTQPTESAPTEPTQTPQPSQPTEPSQPTTPQQPATPPAQQQQPQTEEYETFDEYMERVTKGIDQPVQQPDPEKVDPNDPAKIKQFFDDLVSTAVAKAEQATARKTAITTVERQLWDGAFDKYNSLRTNKPLRDMVHSIRMGYFQRGIAITPVQAADKLLDAMKGQYQKGVADNQVQSTIEQVQPNNGGSGAPVPTTLDKQNILTAVQTGGETALAEILDAEIKAGRL